MTPIEDVLKVQECGCIALPQHIVEKTCLYPGSTSSISVMDDGKAVQITPVNTVSRPAGPSENSCL
jgi:hypothetical protein